MDQNIIRRKRILKCREIRRKGIFEMERNIRGISI